MLQGGYFKVYRNLFSWQYYTDGEMVILWLYLIGNANLTPSEKPPFGRIERGQIVTSVNTLSKVLEMTPKKINLRLEKLQKSGEIVMKKTNKFHIITICNYDLYQGAETEKGKQKKNKGQAKVKPMKNKGQAKDKQKEIIKEEYINTSKDDLYIPEEEEKKKNFFLESEKNEKKVFSISEIKETLDKANVFMSKLGYEKFKENNENPDNKFNYNGGLENSARFFLKKFPEYSVKVAPAIKKEIQSDYSTLEVSAAVKQTLQNIELDFSVNEVQTWIRHIKPVVRDNVLELWCPSKFFAEYIRSNFEDRLATLQQLLDCDKMIYKY